METSSGLSKISVRAGCGATNQNARGSARLCPPVHVRVKLTRSARGTKLYHLFNGGHKRWSKN